MDYLPFIIAHFYNLLTMSSTLDAKCLALIKWLETLPIQRFFVIGWIVTLICLMSFFKLAYEGR
jgi:hypothetical protein